MRIAATSVAAARSAPSSLRSLGIASVDVGSPMWAMHSIRESAGVLDHGYMSAALRNGIWRLIRSAKIGSNTERTCDNC
jgi:hypothetical protein